jgi:hypothetical protein
MIVFITRTWREMFQGVNSQAREHPHHLKMLFLIYVIMSFMFFLNKLGIIGFEHLTPCLVNADMLRGRPHGGFAFATLTIFQPSNLCPMTSGRKMQ